MAIRRLTTDIRRAAIVRAIAIATPSVTRLACRPLLRNMINITIAATRGKADRIISTRVLLFVA
jgi:hypothetical protein